MDLEQARSLLTAEHEQVLEQLGDVRSAQNQDHVAEAEIGDAADPAQSLTSQGVDDAVAISLRDRLAVLERALQRVDDGTYGRSIRSGVLIPEDRLDADPAAEVTVDEAADDEAANR